MKRFYKEVAVAATRAGFTIELDGRSVKTPGKELLILPTAALAEDVAQEWRDQGEEIDPEKMPITKLANTSIDRVGPRFSSVAEEIVRFAGTDLLCYRADEPDELAARQAQTWDPYLDWAKNKLGAQFQITAGIMPVSQSDSAIEAVRDNVVRLSAYELTALHEFTNGFGSIVLALAYMAGLAPFEAIWQASILDQTFQEEHWGEDYEAIEKKEKLLTDLQSACTFLSQVRNKTTGQMA